ncbi:unnamed protein product [Brachionus calyciflorus]|uniref:Uncharacterized protein n=1 Tax=Brachionus calyciflorus TaxID=104777 RepID=A0A813TSJ2_9BILA|nr:unnamed protein product [Brachionus calyciflorus]
MIEINESITEDLKSRVRNTTAKTKGYEKFDKNTFSYPDLDAYSNGEVSTTNDFSHQLDSKNYSKFDILKSKKNFISTKLKSRWLVPPSNTSNFSNIDVALPYSYSVPSIPNITTTVN